MDSIFLSDNREYICPKCKKGVLEYRDHCKRIVRHEGGEAEWIHIPRHKCSNERCRKLHRLLPDFLAPFKHYEEEVICDSIDDRIKPEESDYCPSERTVSHWKFWLWLNTDDINGYMKSIAFRELGYSEELLKSGVSLLDKLRSSMPDGWLKTIIRTIYNSGASLRPFYT